MDDFTPVPAEVRQAARAVSSWMEGHGYRNWVIEGCADFRLLEDLGRQIEQMLLEKRLDEA
jgi:hypothetical protein